MLIALSSPYNGTMILANENIFIYIPTFLVELLVKTTVPHYDDSALSSPYTMILRSANPKIQTNKKHVTFGTMIYFQLLYQQ
jgi:hypothetical protein